MNLTRPFASVMEHQPIGRASDVDAGFTDGDHHRLQVAPPSHFHGANGLNAFHEKNGRPSRSEVVEADGWQALPKRNFRVSRACSPLFQALFHPFPTPCVTHPMTT